MSGWFSAPLAKLDPPQPERIGDYRIESVLGTGGMATVYLASSAASFGCGSFGCGRWCALKVLRSELAENATYLKMFFTEGQIGSEITHPNVCGVFDYGWVEGKAYLAMEYVRGRSLAEVNRAFAQIRDPVRHAARIARIVADASEGLCAIHEHRAFSNAPHQVVHRDISPDNLILTFEGFIKIIDLGLAKAQHLGETTQTGILKGKLAYIAPELLRGEALDARADIWSLGVVAWELVTGKRLFHRSTDAETLNAVMNDDIPPPSAVRQGIPKYFDKVVLGALTRDPAKRYRSAACFADRLWAFLATQRRLIQHRDIDLWLNGLFPGERERVDRLLETPASNHRQPVQEQRRPAPEVARHSQRFSLGLSHIGLFLPTKRAPARAAFMALALIGACGWAWRSLHPGSPNSRQLAASVLSTPSMAPQVPREIAQTKLTTRGGFVVEVERPELSNDVIVRVRPTNEGAKRGDGTADVPQAP